MIRSRGDLLDDQSRREVFDADPPDSIIQQGQPGGGGGGSKISLVKITGHAGTAAPFKYNGVRVAYDASGNLAVANFTVTSATPLGWKLVNLAEIGPGGVGYSPIEDNSIVAVYTLPGGYYGFVGTNYRGTFA